MRLQCANLENGLTFSVHVLVGSSDRSEMIRIHIVSIARVPNFQGHELEVSTGGGV